VIARWRALARRYGWGCEQCGRWTFGRTPMCRTHLAEEYAAITRAVAADRRATLPEDGTDGAP
jgi:hypothetical protein